jgi:hypothetical protein
MRLYDTPKTILALALRTFEGRVVGPRIALLRQKTGSHPSQGLAGRGLSSPPHPRGIEDDDNKTLQARAPHCPLLIQGPLKTRGVQGPPRHKRAAGAGSYRGPRSRERPHLALPAPRSRFASLATVMRAPGTGPEERFSVSGLAGRVRQSSQLAEPRAARSRHLPPLKRRRCRCCSSQEKTVPTAHAPRPRARSHTDVTTAGRRVAASEWRHVEKGKIFPRFERILGEGSFPRASL